MCKISEVDDVIVLCEQQTHSHMHSEQLAVSQVSHKDVYHGRDVSLRYYQALWNPIKSIYHKNAENRSL